MLHGCVEVMGVRGLEVFTPSDDDQATWETCRSAGAGGQRVAAGDRGRRAVQFDQRSERRCQNSVLEEVSLPCKCVVEDAPGRSNGGASGAHGIPHETEARRKVVLVSGIRPARHAGVSWIDQTSWRVGEPRGLDAWMKGVQCVIDVDERLRELVPHSGAHCYVVHRSPFILYEAGIRVDATVLSLIVSRPGELSPDAKQEVGTRIPADRAVEHELAVRAI